MTVDEAVKVYTSRFTGSTRRSMVQRLRGFVAHVKSCDVDTIEQVTTSHIERWLLDLCERSLKPWSVYAYVTAVRHFCTTLHEEQYVKHNPWPVHVRTRRPAHSIRYVPSKEKITEILQAADNCSYPCRTRAILELGYGCGLRRMELRGLNVDDIDGDTVRIRGKGGSVRIVPLGTTARKWIERYINGERLQMIRKHNPLEVALFVSERGNRLSIESYEVMIRRLRKVCSAEGITMHSLRHACATHMLQNGAPVVVLSKLLGHAKVSTTEIYTKVTTDDLKAVLKNKHPRG